jgi:hypothetical protein
MPKIYKCVQLPNYFQVNSRNKNSIAADHIEKVLTEMSNQGWSLHSTTQSSTHEPTGCLEGLLGFKGTYRTLNILIFTQDIP